MVAKCLWIGLLASLSLPLAITNADAQLTTRQQLLAAMDWKTLPGAEFTLDSRSPATAAELLAGGGSPTSVDAHLWMPDNAGGRVPAVVLFNCGNTMVREKEGYYSEVFHRMGYAVLIVNSLSARAPGDRPARPANAAATIAIRLGGIPARREAIGRGILV